MLFHFYVITSPSIHVLYMHSPWGHHRSLISCPFNSYLKIHTVRQWRKGRLLRLLLLVILALALSTHHISQPGAHWALCHAPAEMRGSSEVQGSTPQTSAKWTKFRQNAASYLQLQGRKHTLHGAVGFWASHELPVCCVGRLCFVQAVCLCSFFE